LPNGVAFVGDLLQPWRTDGDAYCISLRISDGARYGAIIADGDAYTPFIFNLTSKGNGILVLRAIAGVDRYVLKVVRAIWILQRAVVQKDAFEAIF
jgi:hypothetical protein